MTGASPSLLGSAQVAHLQESLREARRGLELSQRNKQASDQAKKRIEARLEEYQKKHDEVVGAKLKLENSKLELELQVRLDMVQDRQCNIGTGSSDLNVTFVRWIDSTQW